MADFYKVRGKFKARTTSLELTEYEFNMYLGSRWTSPREVALDAVRSFSAASGSTVVVEDMNTNIKRYFTVVEDSHSRTVEEIP